MTDAPTFPPKPGSLKCVVWDLDDTLWRGTLLEGGGQDLFPGVEAIVQELDARGILQSVASKNDHDLAWPRLMTLGLADYFLHPQIGWWGKSQSIKTIAERLGIGLDAIAFVDDQAPERDEVAFYLPTVTTIDARDLAGLLAMPALTPEHITPEARQRRSMYRADFDRQRAQDQFDGTRDAFLATLEMRMTIRPAVLEDLNRVEELTIRTNQLNTTGGVYSLDELAALASSPQFMLLVAELDDRYGASGTIGLALVETGAKTWVLRLLIMSCRVIARGVGTVLLGHLLREARRRDVGFTAAFLPTDRNRQMLVTFKFAGFREVGQADGSVVLKHDLTRLIPLPDYVTLQTPDAVASAAVVGAD